MSRKPQVRYFPSKSGYFTQVNGHREPLAKGPDDGPTGPTYLRAMEAYLKLVCADDATTPTPDNDCLLSECVGRWLAHVLLYKSQSYHDTSKMLLDAGVKTWGRRPASTLRPMHVTAWLEAAATWNGTTKQTAYERLAQCLAWNATEGHLSVNPLAGKKAPASAKSSPRGEEFAVPDELVDLLIKTAGQDFADYLTALARTGARPGEIANAEDTHYRPDLGAFVFAWNAKTGYVWKNARTKKRDRVIYLPEYVQALVEERIQRQGPGYVFRTPGGEFWKPKRLRDSMQKLRQKKAVREWLAAHGRDPKTVILYGLRHRFITNALLKAVSVKNLADLMGTSIEHITDTYGHAHNELTAMRTIFLGLCE